MNTLRLKELMSIKGMRGKELAEKVGVSENAISAISTGKTQPRFELLLKISDSLDVDIRELFNPTKKADSLNGFIEHNGTVHRIRSLSDIEKLLELVGE